MPRKIIYKHRYFAPSFNQIIQPMGNILQSAPRLESRGNRPLKMDFEEQLNALWPPVQGNLLCSKKFLVFRLFHFHKLPFGITSPCD
jgi:hypothetical protein